MLNPKWSEFWWTNITGANLVVTNVAAALLENKMVVLEVPDDLPWRYQLRTTVELTFRKNVSSESYAIQIIDDSDDCCEQEPGRFLLDRFAKSRSIRMGYRTAGKKSLQEYILDNNVLYNSIIWIKGLDAKRSKEWVNFCKGFNSDSIERGLFVLEVKDFSYSGDTKGVEKISYSDLVTKFDVQLFNSLLLADNGNYSDCWKQYVATLASELCDIDAEISAELINCVDLRHKESTEGFSLIENAGDFARRGAGPHSKHILSYYRKNNDPEIHKRIWSAQLQVLFPIIEMERLKYIKYFYDDIVDVLSHENIVQFDEVITQPNDVELGTLHFLIKSYKINVHSWADRERVSFLRDCRNKIAHMNCCTIDEVRRIINGDEDF